MSITFSISALHPRDGSGLKKIQNIQKQRLPTNQNDIIS
jgi:hypothetical protein